MNSLIIYTYYSHNVADLFETNLRSLINAVDATSIIIKVLVNSRVKIKEILGLFPSNVIIKPIIVPTQEFTSINILTEMRNEDALYVDPKLFFFSKLPINYDTSNFYTDHTYNLSTKLFYIKNSDPIDSIITRLNQVTSTNKVLPADFTYLISNNFLLNKTIHNHFVIDAALLTNTYFNTDIPNTGCFDLSVCLGGRYVKLNGYVKSTNMKSNKPIISLSRLLKKSTTNRTELDSTDNIYTPVNINRTVYFADSKLPTIIIPVYKNYNLLNQCLTSILNTGVEKFNLLVINDSPADESVNNLLKSYKVNFFNTFGISSEYQYIINDKNLGFIKTVNFGISQVDGDIIILNSDTIVSHGWLTRLLEYRIFNKIASVTPLSNSASICSFPKPNVNQSHYRNLTPAQIDSVLSRLPMELCHTSPTGVGFCMLMTREAIDRIGVFDDTNFTVGYGEENDWCMRAIKTGFKNIIAPNIYVAHEHGSSFKSIFGLSKIRQTNANALAKKHPDYGSMVSSYLAKAELMNVIPLLTGMLDFEYFDKKYKRTQLIISHGLGGGSTYFSEVMQKNQQDNGIDCVKLTTSQNGDIIVNYNSVSKKFQYSKLNLQAIIELLKPESIMLNHCITWDLDDIHDIFVNKINIPFSLYLHDFYFICPLINLVTPSNKYCDAETNPHVCESCYRTAINYEIHRSKRTVSVRGIVGWRRISEDLFENAIEIGCPSINTRNIYSKYLPLHKDKIRVWVREDHIPEVPDSFSTDTLTSTDLNIVILGNISRIKGSELIYDLANLIKINKLPITLSVVGAIASSNRPNQVTLKQSGQYTSSTLPTLLKSAKPMIGLIASICPETYSYTTTELFSAKIPVICFNIGAPADRIKDTGFGWVVDDISASSLLEKLKYLLNNKSEIVEIHNLIKLNYHIDITPIKTWFTS